MIESIFRDQLTLRSNHCSKEVLATFNRLRNENLFTDTTLKVGDLTLNLENAVAICHIGKIYSILELSQSAERFLARNFNDLLATESFTDLTHEELTGILNDHALYIESEDMLLNALINWSMINAREDLLMSLMSCVNMNAVSEDCLNHLALTGLTDLVADLRNSNLTPALAQPSLRRQRRTNSLILAIAFDSRLLECLDLEHFDQGWHVLTEVPNMRYGFSGAGISTFGDKVLITGGVGKKGILKAVNRFVVYDLRSNSWSDGPSLKEPRKCHLQGVTQGSLMIAGGTDEQQAVLTAQYLDLKQDPAQWAWLELPTLPSWHNGTSLIEFGQHLIAISNYGSDSDRMFNLRSKIWSNLPLETADSCRMTRDRPGCTKFGEVLILAGGSAGRDLCKEVESYSLETAQWEKHSKLNIGRECPGMAVIQGRMFVIGGKGSTGTVEEYSPETGTWHIVPDMKLKFQNGEYFCATIS
ncbi:hypothetical protein TCAL_00623 [Tigriopus californicus]|uniref:BACK domain-containing protein n=1 Tax=Tigriopus californicus TaxID=6832 RepID=A0A553PBP9_TIGCA|nr:hypothetical protein TCAL_00623 [Tigriopus californicus]